MKNKKIEVGTFTKPSDAKHRGVLNKAALEKVWDEIGPCYGYLKPDGWRIQIHLHDGKINLFTRTGNDESVGEFPLLAKSLQRILGKDQFVLDSEVIGFNREGRPTSLRRIRDATKHAAMILDGLCINGQDITPKPTRERQSIMRSSLTPYAYVDDSLILAEYKLIDSFFALDSLYQDFLNQTGPGYDGIILKGLHSAYFEDAIKVKKEISVDAVVMGVYLSEQGKTKGNNDPDKDWATSLLLAVKDVQTQLWIPICKVTGEDEDWIQVCKMCNGNLSSDDFPKNIVLPPEAPDLWIEPTFVVQITARTIRLGAKDSYIIVAEAPRDIFLREEKDSSLVNTLDQLLEMGGINERPPIPMGLF